MFVIFDRCDGGGTVFVNPEHVVAVTRHDEADTKTELLFIAGGPDKVSVVYGSAQAVAEALGEVRRPRGRLRTDRPVSVHRDSEAFARPVVGRAAISRPGEAGLSEEWRHLES